jgi:hypothetical protein
MRQDLDLDIAGVMAAVRDTGLLSSLCTITRSPAIFNAAGAEDPSAPYVAVAGLVDIPCTAPPLMATDRMQASEIRALRQIKAEDTRHVLLDAYYPAILDTDRALIDGTEFEIANVEHDSQKQMTRLAVERVTI